MRIALLSVLDTPTEPHRVPAPFRMLAGARLVERQLDMAMAAGCETVICFAASVGREVLALQHRAEHAGARFIAISDPQKLSGLVAATDELLVISAGVLPDEDALLRHLAKPGVLVFPEDAAVPRGYERIDARFAWAGALMVRGNAVEQLVQLPGDVDPPSALLRIALQSGVRTHPLETRLLDEHGWLRDPSPEELAAREKSWVARHARVAPFSAPGLAVAERIGTRLAADGASEHLPRILSLSAALAGALSLSLALGGWMVPAFALAALAAVLAAMDGVVRRISLAGQARPQLPWLHRAMAILIDPLLAALIAKASPEDTEWLRLFVPVVLIGLLHLAERLSIAKWRRSFADRVLLGTILVPAALLGVVQPVAAVLALAVLIAIFLASETRD